MIARSTLGMLERARKNRQAVAAFNAFNYEIMKGIHEAAVRMNEPVIIETEHSSLKFCPPEILSDIARGLARDGDLPIGLHLDHCTDVDMTFRAMRCGYSSVMFDGSALPYEENVRLTGQVAAMAAKYGVTVEGELGVIGDERHTDPRLARDFVKRTGVDCLAASVGTAHGLYREAPRLNFELIRELAETSGAMVVLHGGTGVPPADIGRAISLGVAKVNVGTDLRRGFVDAVMARAGEGYVEARDALDAGVARVAAVCEEWIGAVRARK